MPKKYSVEELRIIVNEIDESEVDGFYVQAILDWLEENLKKAKRFLQEKMKDLKT